MDVRHIYSYFQLCPREAVDAPSQQMFKMSRASDIRIYWVTALPTAREVELDGL